MSIDWTTWKAWTTPAGLTVRILVLSGMMGAGALLWYQRDDPRYPTTYDTASIMAALAERSLALMEPGDNYSPVLMSIYPETNASGVVVYREMTNAVPQYPSRLFYGSKITSAIQAMPTYYQSGAGDERHWRFMDLWGASEGSSGAGVISGKAYEESSYHPFANGQQILTLGWWTNNIRTTASARGQFCYQTNAVHYMATGILNQVAMPLSAMRWTATTGLQVAYPTNEVNFYVGWWEATSQWYSVSTPWETMLTEARGNLATAPLTGDNTNGWDRAQLIGHYAYALCQSFGATRRAYVQERIYRSSTKAEYHREYRPTISNEIASVTEAASFLTNFNNAVVTTMSTSASIDGEQFPNQPHYFYHELGAQPLVWETALVSKEAIGSGATMYPATLHRFEGRMDADQLSRAGQTNVFIGWEKGAHVFIVDWRFNHITNAPVFWGTGYGIR